jgi:glycosyltransferase involved in cell wall biosynthesis
MTSNQPVRVAIFVNNPKGVYSGGRYLSLIAAYSLARAGADVTYVTDNLPLFDADFAAFEAVAPIRKLVDFESPGSAQLDWVLVFPSGGITDVVYDAALNCAHRSGARVAVLSFATPNWFNSLCPWPRSGLSWEGWRRTLARGGLVLTIAEAGIEPARAFYASAEHRSPLAYDFWHPPLNDLAADAVAPARHRYGVTVFTRVEDVHKGAADLLRIDPAVLSGQTLSIVSGRGLDPDYHRALSLHFSAANVKIDIRERISDAEKFTLLAGSRLLLFPSYFEGFGYPVVEAAYMGVPSVAYDLPVVRETVGDAAIYAPVGDVAAFSQAVLVSLAREPGPNVRALLRIDPDTLSAGRRLCDVLRTHSASVEPIAQSAAPRTRSVRVTPVSQAHAPPPAIGIGETLYFTIQGNSSDEHLPSGWNERDSMGCSMRADGATLAFALDSRPDTDLRLVFLLRSPAPPRTPLECTIELNASRLGSAELRTPGPRAFEFSVPPDLWAGSGIQVVTFAPRPAQRGGVSFTPLLAGLALLPPSQPPAWGKVCAQRVVTD